MWFLHDFKPIIYFLGFEGIISLLDSEFSDMTNFFSEYPPASKVKMFSLKQESKIPPNFCPEQPGTINGQQMMDRKVSFLPNINMVVLFKWEMDIPVIFATDCYLTRFRNKSPIHFSFEFIDE